MSEPRTCVKWESEARMKYEDSCGCRGAFSDSRKGENAKRNKEQNGQQSRRNGHGRYFRAEVGARCSRRNSGRSHRIQESRSCPNES